MLCSLLYCLCLTLADPGRTSQPAVRWERGEQGETAVVPMAAAPYPHESRKDGFRDGDKFFPREPHYVDHSVALFIPKGFRPGERTDLLVYFHGHYNNIRKALDDFHLREQIVASGRNLVLVFPEGPKDAGDSGGGKIEEPDGLKRLAAEAMQVLVSAEKVRSDKVGQVLLAGHSGAYRALSFCVEHGGLEDHVTGVCLLDSSYGRLDAFVDWAERRREGRLFSIFTDHLSAQNVYLMTHLRRKHVSYLLALDSDATDEMLRRERILFLHTEKLKHNQTVQWLERWLRCTPATQPN